MYLDWKVGDRVCCINDDWTVKVILDDKELNLPNRVPMRDELLTIREVCAGQGDFGTGRDDGVYLAFTDIPVLQRDGEFCCSIYWDAKHFRKVQPRETDISVFTAMLHGASPKVEV